MTRLAHTHAFAPFFQTIFPKSFLLRGQLSDEYKDLLSKYADGTYAYKEFAARVKRRQRGQPEGFDDEPEIDAPEEW